MLEILDYGSDDESSKKTARWALEARNRFFASKNSMRGTYLPLTAPEFLDLDKTYGNNLSELKRIKAEVDPNGVFKHTIPALM